MPGFDEVLAAVADAWRNAAARSLRRPSESTERSWRRSFAAGSAQAELSRDQPLEAAEAALTKASTRTTAASARRRNSPSRSICDLLLRAGGGSRDGDLLDMVNATLDHMAGGGIYDQLGGGFHRYSVDARWLVPHFEKMLYDNALLAGCYLSLAGHRQAALRRACAGNAGLCAPRHDRSRRAASTARRRRQRRRARASSISGRPSEMAAVLGAERAKPFCKVYDVTATGNFEGRNILHRARRDRRCATILHRGPAELEIELAEDRAAAACPPAPSRCGRGATTRCSSIGTG